MLLNAFSQIKEKNVELKLFGEGYDAYFKEIKQRLALDKRIQYRGKFSSQDIGSIHSEIDVLVIPSIWHENSPLVLHEAILAGTPVIASCTGGIPEYVKNMQTGLLFKAGDTQGLLSCMMRFIRDPSLIDLFSNNQKEVSIKSLEEDARQLKRLYVSLRAR